MYSSLCCGATNLMYGTKRLEHEYKYQNAGLSLIIPYVHSITIYVHVYLKVLYSWWANCFQHDTMYNGTVSHDVIYFSVISQKRCWMYSTATTLSSLVWHLNTTEGLAYPPSVSGATLEGHHLVTITYHLSSILPPYLCPTQLSMTIMLLQTLYISPVVKHLPDGYSLAEEVH